MDSKEENREQRHSLSHHNTPLSLFLLFLLVLDKFVSYYCLIKKDNFRVGWWFEIISVQWLIFHRGRVVRQRHPWEPHLPIPSPPLSIIESFSPPLIFAVILKVRLNPKPSINQWFIYLMPSIVKCVSYWFCFLSVAQYFSNGFSGKLTLTAGRDILLLLDQLQHCIVFLLGCRWIMWPKVAN